MFTRARVKLAVMYLAIIMAISFSFSCAIFISVNRELIRFEEEQTLRQKRIDDINLFLRSNGIPIPETSQAKDFDSYRDVRYRFLSALGLINLMILVVSGVGGYFLAGQTLEPIKKNMDDQKAFVADASHELRTPLTSLKAEIEISLRDKKLTLKQAQELMKSNLDDVNRMQKLANYLLDMNRYEDGNIPMSKLNLKDVALKAIGKSKVKTDLRNSFVMGDASSLTELIKILIENAFKYSKKGGVVLVKVKNKTIEVVDNGVGIPKEDLPHVFDRFYRSDKSRGTAGYGLGLSIAKSIVELHKGKIKVKSKVGEGSTFVVEL